MAVCGGCEGGGENWAEAFGNVLFRWGPQSGGGAPSLRLLVATSVGGGRPGVTRPVRRPTQGGQAPYAVYRMALASGLFENLGQVNSLGLLLRL